jgi:hypothetical protein
MEYYDRIKDEYRRSKRNTTRLFQTVMSVADEIGLEATLELLEQCVTEKRLAWLDRHLPSLEKSGDALTDGHRIFYEEYLGISTPKDGEEVEVTERKLVMRWRNECPALNACQELGLDTREICRKVYHGPSQVFLSRIDPRLRFDRDYSAIRPHMPYCEEIITLEELD